MSRARMLRPLRVFVPAVLFAAGAAVVFAVALLSASAGSSQAGTTTAGAAACDAGLQQASYAVADDAEARTVAEGLTSEQRTNAELIIRTTTDRGDPPRAALVALATALQESSLRNLDGGDRDSLGLFQQRPSQGWGTPTQILDPVYATTAFLDALSAVPDWERLPVTVAAQTVQRSAFPDAYARWEGVAAALLAGAGVRDPAGCGPIGSAPPTAPVPQITAAAIDFAMSEIGSDYVWGATGPDTYDCSGLMLRAFEAAGVTLPRVSRDQYRAGAHVPVRQAQAGDLLFYADNPQNPATIRHVVLYLGDDQLVEAPYTGEQVRVRAVDWADPGLVPLATRPGVVDVRG